MSDETYWRPHDKVWLAERKREWRLVKYNLGLYAQEMKQLKREYFKYHEELFFFGTLNPAVRDPTLICDYCITGHGAFIYASPVFRLWYHPAPGSLDLEAMRAEFIQGDHFGNHLTSLAQIFLGICGEGVPCPVDYGAMGGREQLGLKLCLPSMDYRDAYNVASGVDDAYCLPPDDISMTCLYQTQHELRMDARWFPNSPGQ